MKYIPLAFYAVMSFMLHYAYHCLGAIPAAWQDMKTDLKDKDSVYPPENF